MFEQYMFALTISIVDEVCISVAKQHMMEESKEHGDQSNPQILNEKQIPFGKYGWCIMCRAAADMQCSKSSVAVCSEECLVKHIKMLEIADAVVKMSHETMNIVDDSLNVLSCIAKLGAKEVKNPQSALAVKCRTFTLEVMSEMIENAPEVLSSSDKLIEIMKGPICDAIMKNSVSMDKYVFQLSTRVFLSLIQKFKSFFKVEIGVILEEIYLKLIGSNNSLYHHKITTVQTFSKMMQNSNLLIELFLNFDCAKKSNMILKLIVDSIARIIQNSTFKSDSQEDIYLKSVALDSFLNMLKALIEYSKSEEKFPIATNNDANNDTITEQLTDEMQSGNYEQMLVEKNRIQTAVLKFNMKPKSGIAYLLTNKMIASEPEDQKIADILKFFHDNPELDKGKIGEFFGEKDDFNKYSKDS